MSDLFSNILPYEFANSSNKVFSNSANYTFNDSSFSSSFYFFSSSSGYSVFIIIDKSFPSSPERVTVKLITYTNASVWGGNKIFEFLVVRNSLKPSLKSTGFSPIITTQRGP